MRAGRRVIDGPRRRRATTHRGTVATAPNGARPLTRVAALVQAVEISGRRPGARRLPVTVRQGSALHRALTVGPWVLGGLAVVYVVFAHEIGFAPGTIDQPFRIGQINDVIAFAVAILGLDLVIGFSGQLSLGQSAFVGLGAFTTMILVADHGWSIFATACRSAAVVCFVVGLLIGLPASRLRGPYLAVVTLAMAYVFPALILRYDWLTGGPNGKRPDRGVGRAAPAVVDAVRRRRTPGPTAVDLLHPRRDGHGAVPAGPQPRPQPARPGAPRGTRRPDRRDRPAASTWRSTRRWRSPSARCTEGSAGRC